MSETPTTIRIDETEYVRADQVTADHSNSPVRIVIAQRGWVFVGRYTRDDERVTLSNARVIRKWGTSKGLGELVNGPLSGTTLDPAGFVELHELAVVATLAADADAWGL
jgi:hypothetical protein|tara:strand:+ start:686 stop:1012 length:327 start_codon:yes stop_codon:yes gene_type:complete